MKTRSAATLLLAIAVLACAEEPETAKPADPVRDARQERQRQVEQRMAEKREQREAQIKADREYLLGIYEIDVDHPRWTDQKLLEHAGRQRIIRSECDDERRYLEEGIGYSMTASHVDCDWLRETARRHRIAGD